MCTFTRNQLMIELPRLAASEPLPLEVVKFGQDDFTSPSSEQSIEAYRGSKQMFNNGIMFWIATLQAQDWSGREAYFVSYLESGLCDPIGREAFGEIVIEHSGSLQKPLPEFLLSLDGFQSGLRMYADWNDVGIVAELPDSFIAFFWSTSA